MQVEHPPAHRPGLESLGEEARVCVWAREGKVTGPLGKVLPARPRGPTCQRGSAWLLAKSRAPVCCRRSWGKAKHSSRQQKRHPVPPLRAAALCGRGLRKACSALCPTSRSSVSQVGPRGGAEQPAGRVGPWLQSAQRWGQAPAGTPQGHLVAPQSLSAHPWTVTVPLELSCQEQS